MLLANQLRQEGISCEIMLEGKHKFGKQLALAEKKGYRYVLILGSDKLQKGIVNLKDLISGEQKTISLQSLVQDLKNELLL